MSNKRIAKELVRIAKDLSAQDLPSRVVINMTNDFHNTSTKLIVKNGIVNPRQVKSVWNKLCGIQHCSCGDDFGRRGKQPKQKYELLPSSEHGYFELVEI